MISRSLPVLFAFFAASSAGAATTTYECHALNHAADPVSVMATLTIPTPETATSASVATTFFPVIGVTLTATTNVYVGTEPEGAIGYQLALTGMNAAYGNLTEVVGTGALPKIFQLVAEEGALEISCTKK
jgi:hypothetical protein